ILDTARFGRYSQSFFCLLSRHREDHGDLNGAQDKNSTRKGSADMRTLMTFISALALMISPVFGDETPQGGRAEPGMETQRRSFVVRPHRLAVEGEAFVASTDRPAPETEARRKQHRL